MKKIIFIVTIVATIFTFTGCQKLNDFIHIDHPDKDAKADAGVAIDWYRLQTRMMLERNTTLNAVYFCYLGVGLYEAVRHESRNSVSFSTKLNQMPLMPDINDQSYDWVLSANAAMADMLRSFNTGLTPANLASIDSLENAYNKNSHTNPGSDKFLRSQAYGKSIAAAMHDWFLTDNFNPGNAGYVPPVFFGAWVPTPPAFANGINPYLSTARYFLASNASIAVPRAPFPYSEDANSDFYNMVKKVYDISKVRTTDQTNLALFFNDQGNGVGFTPGGHHFTTIIQILETKKVGLGVAAEVFAKAGIAERDGTIKVFTEKYVNNQMRPVTYIRHLIDTGWLPLLITPPHPEYPAAHATITGCVMQAVAGVLGNRLSFEDHSYDFRGYPSQSFTTIFGVAEASGMSRFYGGIHYLPSIKAGWDIAKQLGTDVGNIKLTN
jgi:PAP2 superfamily